MTTTSPDPNEGLRRDYIEKLATSFVFFLTELWREIGFKTKLPRHHRDFAEHLQYGKRRRGILAWRGAAKTWITIAFCLWRLFVNARKERITYVSKSERSAKDSLYLARKWLGQVRFLQHLTPQKILDDRDAALNFDVRGADPDRAASFAAFGLTGQVTSARSTLIICDDGETPENTLTRDMRLRLQARVGEFENIIVPDGDIIYLGTPHHEETLYAYLIDGGYQFKAWPVRCVERESVGCPLGPMYDDMKVGDLAWPERFDAEELAAKEAAEGRSRFAMQLLLQWKTSDDNRLPLKLNDLIVFTPQPDKAPATITWGTSDHHGQSTRIEELVSLGLGEDCFHKPIMFDQEWQPFKGIRMWVDPAGSGTDEVGLSTVAHLNGFLWALDSDGLKGGYSSANIELIARKAMSLNVDTMYVEDNFGQGMMADLIQPAINRLVASGEREGWHCRVQTEPVKGQKEVRIIETLEPLLNQHRLVFHPSVAQDHILQRQMTRISRQPRCLDHDDRIEALAMCCKMWRQDIALDPAISAERSKQKALLDEIKRIQGNARDRDGANRWFSHR